MFSVVSEAAPLGRDRELADVERFLDRVPEGPHALALTGPAGIGKTTVWREAVRRAAARGWTVLTSRPAQSEARLAFAALADLLGPIALDRLNLNPIHRHALGVAMLREQSGADAFDVRAVGTAVLSVLRQLVTQGPLVIAVDDSQWLDTASADALSFAIRRLENVPVGVLASVRVEASRPQTFETSIPVTEIQVAPLGVAAMHEIVKQHLSVAVPRPLLVQIVVASGGNPFYAVEIARELVRKGLPAPGAKLPIPSSLMTLVKMRLALLPPETREALLLAASLSHPTADHVDLGALEAAEEEGIVHVEDGSRVRFDHPLLAAAVYESASAARRLAAHRRLADVVTDPEEQAIHLASGTTAPDEAIAARIETAAARAARRGATAMAGQLARRAAELTPGIGAERGIRRIMKAADYMSDAAESTADTVALLEKGLAMCQDDELRAELHYTLARITRGDDRPHSGLNGLDEALGLARDRVLKGRIHGEIAWQLITDVRRALTHCDAALQLLREADNPTLYSTTLLLRAYLRLISGMGPNDDAVERARLLQVADRDASPVPLAWPVMRDDFDEGRNRYERALSESRAVGDELSGVSLLSHLAELELWSGNWLRADQLATEAVELVERSGTAAFLNTALYARGIVDAHLGRVDAARASAERILGLDTHLAADGAMRGHMVLGFLALSLDDMEDAEMHLAAVAALLDRRGECEPARFRIHPDLVEAVIARGDQQRAAQMLERLDERARVFPRPWILAAAARNRALLLAAGGDPAGALAKVEEALRHHESLAMPFERARTLLVKGRLLRRRNERRAARVALEEALGVFELLGAPLWAAGALGELARIPVRRAPSGLTPTEEKIARLAAQGFTNREVAERAFVSAKTVEANLARVYDKLGVRSRAELGRVMGERERAGKT
jgi:DNA-binding CsgD family transcriptional regulator